MPKTPGEPVSFWRLLPSAGESHDGKQTAFNSRTPKEI